MADLGRGVHVFTWSMAEELAVGHMRAIGFSDARRTAAGADGGIDVVARDAVAQVKNHAQPVGAPDVQRLRGAAHSQTHAVFYSLSGYTAQATEFADRTKVALFRYDQTNQVTAHNSCALALMGLAQEQSLPASVNTFLDELLPLAQVIIETNRALVALSTEVAQRVRSELVVPADEGTSAHPPSAAVVVGFPELMAALEAVASTIARYSEVQPPLIEALNAAADGVRSSANQVQRAMASARMDLLVVEAREALSALRRDQVQAARAICSLEGIDPVSLSITPEELAPTQ